MCWLSGTVCGLQGENSEVKLLRTGPAGQERPAVLAADGRLLDLSTVAADIGRDFFATGGLDRARGALRTARLPAVTAAFEVNHLVRYLSSRAQVGAR